MDLKEVRRTAKEKLSGHCRVCSTCDGQRCAGEVPGMGGVGTGASFRANVEALAAWQLNLRTLHAVRTPSTALTLWGEPLGMPILGAPMTGCVYNIGGAVSEDALARHLVGGALQAGTLGMVGDGADPTMLEAGLTALREHGGRGAAILKPRAQAEILARLDRAARAGARAVGVDVDGAGLVTMALKGQPVGPKSPAELQELVRATPLPFILKGIMTPDEALIAVDVGARAVVVSNHGGRILDHTPGAAAVLPAIAERVKGQLTILVDGGVRTGADVLKLLALGADAVLVGRPLLVGAAGGGQDGVALVLNTLRNELVQAMLLTGSADVCRVERRVLAGPC